MRRDYTRSFIPVNVKTSIFDTDFQADYDLTVHMKSRTLSDNTTNINITGIRTHHNTTGISVTTCHSQVYLDILNQNSDPLQPIENTGSNKYETNIKSERLDNQDTPDYCHINHSSLGKHLTRCYEMALSDRQTVHTLPHYTCFLNMGRPTSGSVWTTDD